MFYCGKRNGFSLGLLGILKAQTSFFNISLLRDRLREAILENVELCEKTFL